MNTTYLHSQLRSARGPNGYLWPCCDDGACILSGLALDIHLVRDLRSHHFSCIICAERILLGLVYLRLDSICSE